MKPAWDKLIKEYNNSDTLLVADVDCTASGKSKCAEVGIRGYPTIMYGDPDNLQDYKGGRSFEELKKFAAGLEVPRCSPSNLELCDEETKKKISEFIALSEAKREEMISEGTAKIEKLEKDFKSMVENMNKQYQEEETRQNEAIAAIRASGLGILKKVHAYEEQKQNQMGKTGKIGEQEGEL